MSRQAVLVTKVSRRFVVEVDNPMAAIDLPPVPWFIRGPRGGWYIATGERERFITETGDDFMRNVVSVVDRSEGVRYLRPGSRLYKEATA